MIAIKKEPGRRARVVEIENDLKALQQAVGGWIETVTLPNGLCVICDEEGLLKRKSYNTYIGGIDFVGTILIVGVDGENFADVPEEWLCPMLNAL